MYATHVLATILSDHRKVAVALAVAMAFAVIAAVTLYIQASTGAPAATHLYGLQPGSFYHAATLASYYHTAQPATHLYG